MDKKLLIDEYLQGKHPTEQEKWELPTESELDRDEALYDALLAERNRSPLLWRGWGRLLLSVAAVLIAVLALFTWKGFKTQDESQLASEENTTRSKVIHNTLKDSLQHVENSLTPGREKKHAVANSQTSHVKLANQTRLVGQLATPSLKTRQPASVNEPQPAAENVVLTNAADSLYYYLTQLENQMGDCRDSTCLAELTGLMRADERIKDLVNKIINKQVETAYQEEYLVDTTTRYIPL